MRLLNLSTMMLETFARHDHDETPPYAILSHTWKEGKEILFEDFMLESLSLECPPKNLKVQKWEGWCKLYRFCKEAKRLGYTHGWIDTACIDKSVSISSAKEFFCMIAANPLKSSAELSEAINSMWTWYFESDCCLVHLEESTINMKGDGNRHKWFTRGWT